MQTAYIYVRLSRAEVVGAGTLEDKFENRVEQCQELARRHDLGRIPDEHVMVERASGGSLANRPLMTQLLDMAVSGQCTHIITTHVDRITRGDKRDEQEIEDALTEGGVTLISHEGVEVFNAERDPAFLEFRLMVARTERRKYIAKRKGANAEMFKANRRRSGQAPYGYRRIGYIDKKDTYEQIPDEIAVVREIFRRRQAGETAYRIATDLNARGIRNRRGHEWNDWRVKCITHNPFYAGYQGKRSEIVGGKRIRYDREHPEQMQLPPEPGDWPTIITLDEWRQVAGVAGSTPRDWTGSKSLLTGILYCSEGSPMRTQSADTYSCSHKCPPHRGRHIRDVKINGWVLGWVMQVIERIDTSELPKPNADKQEAVQAYASVCKQTSTARARLEKMKTDYLFLVELYGQEEYRKVYKDCEKQLAAAEKEQERLQLAVAVSSRSDAFPALKLLRDKPGMFAAYDIFQKRKIMQALIERIDLLPMTGARISGAKVTWHPEWNRWIGEPPPFKLAPNATHSRLRK